MSRPAVASWRKFSRSFRWNPGEHVTTIGHTGSGKSHLLRALLAQRRYVVVLGTKPKDPTLDGFVSDGFTRISRWPPPGDVSRVLLWPRIRERADLAGLGPTFRNALDDIFIEGSWTVYVDELHYAESRLGLGDQLTDLWEQGRSLGVSVVAATQRPANVSLLAYSQATHVFLYRSTDDRDLSRLAELGGGHDKRELRDVVRHLPRFAFAYINTRTGALTVSRAPAPKG